MPLIALRFTAIALFLAVGAPVSAATELFFDPQDGMPDLSGFVATRAGFVPVISPITEPAIGYGASGALLFVHRDPEVPLSEEPPSLTFGAVFGTTNESWGTAVGHFGVNKAGTIRYTGVTAWTDVNLTFYGTAGSRQLHREFNVQAIPLVQQVLLRVGDSGFFIGPRAAFVYTSVKFDLKREVPGVGDPELDFKTSGLGLVLEYDSRDSVFTPSRGIRAKAVSSVYGPALGGDFSYQEGKVDALAYWDPLPGRLILGLRLEAQFSAGDIPFFYRPSVNLRGVPALRYQSNHVLLSELQVRWMVIDRIGVVAFAGLASAFKEASEIRSEDLVYNVGGGLRYLLARAFGLQSGIDVARGPEQWAFYVVVGSAWSQFL